MCATHEQDQTPPVVVDPTNTGTICLWPPNYNWFCWYYTNEDSPRSQFTNGIGDNCDYLSGGSERSAIMVGADGPTGK
jgi:hypothetical protein